MSPVRCDRTLKTFKMPGYFIQVAGSPDNAEDAFTSTGWPSEPGNKSVLAINVSSTSIPTLHQLSFTVTGGEETNVKILIIDDTNASNNKSVEVLKEVSIVRIKI